MQGLRTAKTGAIYFSQLSDHVTWDSVAVRQRGGETAGRWDSRAVSNQPVLPGISLIYKPQVDNLDICADSNFE